MLGRKSLEVLGDSSMLLSPFLICFYIHLEKLEMTKIHHCSTDSLSVCKECGITLKMVNRLHDHGIHTWANVGTAFYDRSIHNLSGVGVGTLSALQKGFVAPLAMPTRTTYG